MFPSRTRAFVLACLALLLLAPFVLAQETDPNAPDSSAAAAGLFGGAGLGLGCVCLIALIAVVGLAVHVAILVFVYRDAQARGQDPTLWLLLVFFTTWVGLIVWLIVRPEKKAY